LILRILVVTKPTNLELHGERVKANIRKGIPSAEVMLERLEVAHHQHKHSLEDVCSFLKQQGVDYRLHQRAESWPSDFAFELVITVGGDGTLLYASHHIPENGKIVGIRSTNASVGFTCLTGSQHVRSALADVLNGRINYIQCARAQLEIQHVGGSVHRSVPVLNDILYANRSPAATTRYRIELGDQHEVQKSSGVWICTPMGSTAAILAAGGVEQDLTDREFQFKVRELYRPLGKRFDLVGQTYDPDLQTLTIENRSESAIVALDGQHGEIPLLFGDLIRIRRGPSLMLAAPEHKYPPSL
jgi:NAD+ kinase